MPRTGIERALARERLKSNARALTAQKAEPGAADGCAARCPAGDVQRVARQADPESHQEGASDTATLQHGTYAESMENIFTIRERLAMAAGMTIAVMAIICAFGGTGKSVEN